jgi:hypothetical protein
VLTLDPIGRALAAQCIARHEASLVDGILAEPRTDADVRALLVRIRERQAATIRREWPAPQMPRGRGRTR